MKIFAADEFLLRTALHLFTHALELPGIGTPLFLGRPGIPSVRASQLAYLRALEHRQKKHDHLLLRTDLPDQGIRHELKFDQRVAETLHLFACGYFDDRIPGRGGNPDGQLDEIDDGMEADLGRRGRRNRKRRGRRGGEDEDEDDEDDDEDGGEDAEDETDRAIEEIFEHHLHGKEGQDIMEKVQIIVTHMTRPTRDDNGDVVVGAPEEDAGCIIFFCVMDPLYSVGKAMSRLISMCEELRNYRMGMRAANMTDADSVPGGGGGGRRKFTSNFPATPRLVQHFPWLNESDHKTNALHTLNMDAYLELVSFVRDEPEMLTGDRNKLTARGISDPGKTDNPNKLHPINTFTPEWACSVMKEYGVPDSQCDMCVFKNGGENGMSWEFNIEEALGDATAAAVVNSKWYFPPLRSYHYPQEGWTWARRGFAGLHAQYFPWVRVPEALARIASVRTESSALTLYEGDNDNNVLSRNWTRAMVVEGQGIRRVLPHVPYDPNALEKHNAIFQVATENRKILETLKGPADPKANPAEYAVFCKEMEMHRKACFMRLQQVMTTTGHIYPSLKTILGWVSQNVKRAGTYLHHLTWNPRLVAPEMQDMTSFAQYMLKQAIDVKVNRHIVCEARHWQMTHYGAQDCHSMIGVDMHYNAIYHGLSQTGKSFMVKDATVKVMIPETVSTILESSRRAYNTHDDYVGVTLFKDELEDVYVSAKAAENDKTGRAEQIKSMMSDHKTTYRSLVFVDQANGRSKREAEDIEALYHVTMLCCTNKKVAGGDEAIASRFLNFVMTRSDKDLFEYQGVKDRIDEDDVEYNNDLIHAWRIKQALIALSMVLIDGGVLPEPSMHAFDKIQSCVLAYLKYMGINTQEIRGTQMVKRLARVYVVLNMILMLYDVPGAPFATKDFDMEQLVAGIPYLFCDKQIAFFAITQTSEIYLHPVRGVVLRAAFIQARLPFSEGKSVDEYFREDPLKNIQWRIDEAGTADARMNFNYIALKGKYRETIVVGLARDSIPKVGENEVDAEMTAMCKTFIEVKPIRPISFESYWNLAGPEISGRTMQRLEKTEKIPVVVRDDARDCIYVAVEAFARLDENLIIEAIASCCHLKFRPQVFLTGVHAKSAHPTQPGVTAYHTELYQILNIDKEYIVSSCIRSSFVSPDVLYVSPSHRAALSGPSLHPDKAAAGKSYSKKRVKRVDPVTVIDMDLDDWAHEMHHYNSACPGTPEDSPSRPLNVYARIRAALLELDFAIQHNEEEEDVSLRTNLTKEGTRFFNYPYQFIEENEYALRMADEARPFAERTHIMQETYDIELAEWKQLPLTVQKKTPPPVAPRLSNTTADPRSRNQRKAAALIGHVATYEAAAKSKALAQYKQANVDMIARGEPCNWQHKDNPQDLRKRKTMLAAAKAETRRKEEEVARRAEMESTRHTATTYEVVAADEDASQSRGGGGGAEKRGRAAPLLDEEAARDGFEENQRPFRQLRIGAPTQSASRASAIRGEEMSRMLQESISTGAYDDEEDDE